MHQLSSTVKRRIGNSLALLGGAGLALPSMAQTTAACSISLGYAPVATAVSVAPVPTVTTLGVLALSAIVAGVGAVKFKSARNKALMGLALAATCLGVVPSDGRAQAAVAYVFNLATGGVFSDSAIPYTATPALQAVTNTSGVPQRIVSNANATDSGTCLVGAVIAPGASCTTMPSCTAPALLQMDAIDPVVSCDTSAAAVYSRPIPSGNIVGWPLRMETAPVFSPAAPVPVVTFNNPSYPDPAALTVDGGGNPTQLNVDLQLTGVVTAVAPAGYGFGPALEPTKTWQFPLLCYSVSIY